MWLPDVVYYLHKIGGGVGIFLIIWSNLGSLFSLFLLRCDDGRDIGIMLP